MTEQSHAVFLSYASQDAQAAQRICEALRAAGVEVFFDQSELRGGDVWDQRIRREIHGCALFIPIVSEHTQERLEGYFRHEWKLAVERTHHMAEQKPFLVPVVIDRTRDQDAIVPDLFRAVQWTRLPAGETPPAFIERVRRLLSPEAHHAPPTAPVAVGRLPGAITATHAPIASARRWLNPAFLATVGLTVVAAGYFLSERLMLAKRSATPAAHSHTLPPLAIPEKSIAVLPFLDMSEKRDQDYFSDGLAEELLDLLSQVPDLSVAARTSSFYFKGRSEELATIAQKLRVAHILEGSVRKAGDRIRVTVQLIRAENGYHLWSQTYDRSVEDIFKVQDEIAAGVVEALKARLLPTQQLVNQHRTDNLDAYAQYLLGNKLSVPDTPESNQHALIAYRRAAELDPRYAAAYSALAVREWRVADQVTGEAAGYQRAAAAADKAIALAPASPEGYWARGTLRYLNSFDWNGANADFQKALSLDANHVLTLVSYGRLKATLKRIPEAVALTRRGLAFDPLSSEAWGWMGYYLLISGQVAAARDAIAHRGSGDPSYPGTEWIIELIEDKPRAALAAAHRAFRDQALWAASLAQHSLGHPAESQGALEVLIKDRADTWAYQIAETYAWRGERDEAFTWLERAYQQHDAGLTLLANDPLLRSLHGDQRFKVWLRRMNLPE